MFYYIKGEAAHIEPHLIVVDCGGVGYCCHTSSSSLSKVSVGDKVKLFTYPYIREDTFDIYGFVTLQELNCFKLLIGVSGVGPKAAISIMSSGTPDQLAMAVLSGDEKFLTASPGIGKKIAQRIILELKDKMKGSFPENQIDLASGFVPGGKTAEASAALSVLGYNQKDIIEALTGVDTEALTLEEIIKTALKKMVRR